MPRRSRRAKAKHRAIIAKAVQEGRLAQAKPVSAESWRQTPVLQRPQEAADRYQYVLSDVKRIGIIAGAIILVIMILSFVPW